MNPPDQAAETLPTPPAAPHASAPPSALSRLPWLLALTGLILVIVFYPLHLRGDWLRPIIEGWQARAETSGAFALIVEQLEPWLSWLQSPLIFKGALAAACAMAFVVVTVACGLLAPKQTPSAGSPLRFVTLLAFLAWGVASAFWSPTSATSFEAVMWWLTFGLFAFILLRRGISGEESLQLGVLLMILGAVVSAISIAQATGAFSGRIFDFLLRFEDPRNRYGSLMGHNSAVAIFLLLTLFPALGFAFAGAGRAGRLIAAAYAIVAIFTIFIVQSRSIWLISLVLVPAFCMAGARDLDRRLSGRLVAGLAAAFVLILATQAVDSPRNPLYIADNPIHKRLADLTPTQLRKETRLRALVCSRSLVEENPLFGSGLYSFRYVYPKAQADYLALHPDSRLGRTLLRLQRAHNDYLQILVEQGLIGLALALLLAGELIRRGLAARRARRELGAASHHDRLVRLVHLAFGFSALAMALHAGIDFPFQIPQILVPWLLCLAAFAAPEVPGPDSKINVASRPLESPGPLEPPESSDTQSDPAPRDFRIGNVARLVLATSIVSSIPFGLFPYVRAVQADVDYLFASSYYQTILDTGPDLPLPARSRLVEGSLMRLKRAVQTRPAFDIAWYLTAEVHLNRGGLALARESAQARSGTPADPAMGSVRAIAASDYRAGVAAIERSLATLQFSGQYYVLAMCYRELARLDDPAEQAGYLKAYEDALERTLYFTPGDASALYLLAEWEASRPRPNSRKVAYLRGALLRDRPDRFYRFYEAPAYAQIEERNFDAARRSAAALIQTDATNPSYYKIAMSAFMLGARPEDRPKVLEIIRAFRALEVGPDQRDNHPIHSSFGRLYEALILGHWGTALGDLDRHATHDVRGRARLLAVEDIVRRKVGRRGLPTRFTRPKELESQEWLTICAEEKATVQFRYFLDFAGAAEAFASRLELFDSEPPPGFWIDYAQLAARLGNAELLERCIDGLRGSDPTNRALGRLVQMAAGLEAEHAETGNGDSGELEKSAGAGETNAPSQAPIQ